MGACQRWRVRRHHRRRASGDDCRIRVAEEHSPGHNAKQYLTNLTDSRKKRSIPSRQWAWRGKTQVTRQDRASCGLEGLAHEVVLFERTRPLSHRPIFEIDNPVRGRATDEFSDKSARDIVLLNRPEWTRNQTPQPSNIARRMGIACDDARAENRQAFEAYPLNRFFF